VTLFEDHPESDGSLTDSLINDKDNRSIVSDGAVHVCVMQFLA